MPELPEAERARQQIEKVLGREIAAVDDSDGYVCRPHAPGEIEAALVGRSLTAAHRRGKFLWAETGEGGPELGLHLGMAGRIVVDGAPAPRGWDRFSIEFTDGGRMALRDKRRLGRARARAGPLPRRPGRRRGRAQGLRRPRRARHRADQGAPARPGRGRRHRQPPGRRGALAGAPLAAAARRRPRAGGAQAPPHARSGAPSAARSSAAASTRATSSPTAAAGERCPRDGAAMTKARIGGRTTWWCPACQVDPRVEPEHRVRLGAGSSGAEPRRRTARQPQAVGGICRHPDETCPAA